MYLQTFLLLKGRVSVKVMTKKARREMRKSDRKNQVNDVGFLSMYSRQEMLFCTMYRRGNSAAINDLRPLWPRGLLGARAHLHTSL